MGLFNIFKKREKKQKPKTPKEREFKGGKEIVFSTFILNEETLRRIFDNNNKSVIKDIASALARYGKEKYVSVLYIKISFEEFSKLKHDKLRIIESLIGKLLERIIACGGTPELIGKDILVFFNIIPQHKYLEASIKCAMQLVDVIKDLNFKIQQKIEDFELKIKIGLNSGKILAEITRDSLRYTEENSLIKKARFMATKAKNSGIFMTNDIAEDTKNIVDTKKLGLATFAEKVLQINKIEGLSAKEKFRPYIKRVEDTFGTREKKEKEEKEKPAEELIKK